MAIAGSWIFVRVPLLATLFVLAGCSSRQSGNSSSTTVGSDLPRTAHTTSALSSAGAATGKPYDFYVLNLSWSPEYCVTNPGAVECAQHLGFVVHGLWPQNFDGSYPKNCGNRPGPTNASDWQGLLPTASLAQHEWVTHGVCTPYDADTYFGLIRKARAEVQIPPAFDSPLQPASAAPADIVAQFAKINTGIPAGGIVLSCGNNALTAVEFCFDKNLKAIECQGLHTCGARTVKIPSIGAAQSAR